MSLVNEAVFSLLDTISRQSLIESNRLICTYYCKVFFIITFEDHFYLLINLT